MLRTLAEKVHPENCAILIVDVQNDFCAEGGAMHREGRDLGRAGVAGHDLVHRPAGLAPRQFLPARQAAEDLRPRPRLPGRTPWGRGFG